ncbi:hypothetical protein [Burkholderia ubonensis]|uniref:hypothetical protein n=1 Tax=Burkholderia ubonensis TaxID=101571 RepID=UPI0012FAF749|nr:hypothetical protein [Burkholderia ubonensis]
MPAAANAERTAREREPLRGSFRNDAGDSGPANAVRREQQDCMAVSGGIECPDRSEPIASPRACKDRREQKRMIVFASTRAFDGGAADGKRAGRNGVTMRIRFAT